MKKSIFNLAILTSLFLASCSCSNNTASTFVSPESEEENKTQIVNNEEQPKENDGYIYSLDSLNLYTFHEERHEYRYYDDYGVPTGQVDVWYTRWYTFEKERLIDITDNTYRGKEVIIKDKIEWTNPETKETELLEVRGLDKITMTIQDNDYIERIIIGDKSTQYLQNRFQIKGVCNMPNLVDIKGWVYQIDSLDPTNGYNPLDNVPNLAVPIRMMGGIPRLFGSPKLHTFIINSYDFFINNKHCYPNNNQNGSNKMTEELGAFELRKMADQNGCLKGTNVFRLCQDPTPEELEKYNLWHWRDSDGEPEKW